jgi:hypothetical protein
VPGNAHHGATSGSGLEPAPLHYADLLHAQTPAGNVGLPGANGGCRLGASAVGPIGQPGAALHGTPLPEELGDHEGDRVQPEASPEFPDLRTPGNN